MSDSPKALKKLGHQSVIDLIRAFAPNIPEGGVCNGFTSMWLQAHLGGKENEQDFYNRLDRITDFIKKSNDFKNLKNEIEMLYKERSEKLNKTCAEAREKAITERNYLLPLTKEQENELENIDKQVRAQFPPFTEDELEKIELRAFAEAVAIQQHPTSLGLVAFETIEPNEQSRSIFKEPKSKYKVPQYDKNLLYGITLDEKEKKIDAKFVGVVATDKNELRNYFTEMAEIIKTDNKINSSIDKQTAPIAFLLSSDNHSVGVYFDLKTDNWHFLNINRLSDKQKYFFDVSSEDIPENIFSSLLDSNSDNTVFSVQCLSKGASNELIEQLKDPAKKRLANTLGKTNSRMWNSLHIACIQGELESANALIKIMQPKNLNTKETSGHTALLIAAQLEHKEIVKELIVAKAELNHTNKAGYTALMLAVKSGNTDIVNALIGAGADLNIADYIGNTALMLAVKSGNTDIVKALIEKGAVDKDSSALLWAAEKGHTEIVKALIKAGVNNLNIANSDGYTALMLAAQNDHTEVVRALIKEGVNLEHFDEIWGATALLLAALNGHLEIVKDLIKAGSNINTVNEYGETALVLLAKNGHTEIIKDLIKEGKVSAENLNIADRHGYTALTWATQNGDTEAIKALSVAGTKYLNIAEKDRTITLMFAAQSGHTEVVRALIEAGANLNIVDDSGYTALMLAASNGHTEVVRALIDAGANLNIVDDYGCTALMLAASNGHTEVVRALIDAGAYLLNISDNFGTTAIMLAANNGHTEIVTLLEKAAKKVSSPKEGDEFDPLSKQTRGLHFGFKTTTEISKNPEPPEKTHNKSQKPR